MRPRVAVLSQLPPALSSVLKRAASATISLLQLTDYSPLTSVKCKMKNKYVQHMCLWAALKMRARQIQVRQGDWGGPGEDAASLLRWMSRFTYHMGDMGTTCASRKTPEVTLCFLQRSISTLFLFPLRVCANLRANPESIIPRKLFMREFASITPRSGSVCVCAGERFAEKSGGCAPGWLETRLPWPNGTRCTRAPERHGGK